MLFAVDNGDKSSSPIRQPPLLPRRPQQRGPATTACRAPTRRSAQLARASARPCFGSPMLRLAHAPARPCSGAACPASAAAARLPHRCTRPRRAPPLRMSVTCPRWRADASGQGQSFLLQRARSRDRRRCFMLHDSLAPEPPNSPDSMHLSHYIAPRCRSVTRKRSSIGFSAPWPGLLQLARSAAATVCPGGRPRRCATHCARAGREPRASHGHAFKALLLLDIHYRLRNPAETWAAAMPRG